MVTITVSAILVAVAVPTYRGLIISNRLTTATNEFVAAINIAKIEAIRRNRPTQFCTNSAVSNGDDPFKTACGSTAGAVFVLESDGSTTTKLYEAPKVPTDISLSLTGALRFGGQGLAQMVNGTVPLYSGLVADLSTTKISNSNRRCIYMTTGGAISTCSLTSLNGCPPNETSSCQ